MGKEKEADNKEKPKATLEAIKLANLGDPIASLEKEYGKPIKTAKSEEYEDVTVFTFEPKENIRIVASVWKGVVHSAVYWHLDEESDPDSELLHVGMTYSAGKSWVQLSPGYLYQTEDNKYRLWCSAVPAIGVGTVEFLSGRVSIPKKDELQNTAGEVDMPAK